MLDQSGQRSVFSAWTAATTEEWAAGCAAYACSFFFSFDAAAVDAVADASGFERFAGGAQGASEAAFDCAFPFSGSDGVVGDGLFAGVGREFRLVGEIGLPCPFEHHIICEGEMGNAAVEAAAAVGVAGLLYVL